jgi:hypothetical protein
MNIRNVRVQEANRIKNTIQNQMRAIQTYDTAGAPVNGYRSLGFYQIGRSTNGNGNQMVMGSHTGNGNKVS